MRSNDLFGGLSGDHRADGDFATDAETASWSPRVKAGVVAAPFAGVSAMATMWLVQDGGWARLAEFWFLPVATGAIALWVAIWGLSGYRRPDSQPTADILTSIMTGSGIALTFAPLAGATEWNMGVPWSAAIVLTLAGVGLLFGAWLRTPSEHLDAVGGRATRLDIWAMGRANLRQPAGILAVPATMLLLALALSVATGGGLSFWSGSDGETVHATCTDIDRLLDTAHHNVTAAGQDDLDALLNGGPAERELVTHELASGANVFVLTGDWDGGPEDVRVRFAGSDDGGGGADLRKGEPMLVNWNDPDVTVSMDAEPDDVEFHLVFEDRYQAVC